MNNNIKAGSDIHAGDGGYSEGTQEDYEKFAKARGQSLLKMRLQEFEKASGMDVYGLGAKRDMWESRLEKFAQLIVAECAKIADTERSNSVGCGYITKTNGMRIKEHFGVEE